jgi:hypothetical protein
VPLLYELIEKSAYAGLLLQNGDGSMPPGHGGPWSVPETPARNTGHWLVTFLKAHDITGKKQFLLSANRAADYLASKIVRPAGFAFWHRKSAVKSGSNGLIGQAWTMEALAIASEKLQRPELGQLAENVFLQHHYDEFLSLWSVLQVDGTTGGLMKTINQQIWFAAAGSLIMKLPFVSPVIGMRVEQFLQHLPEHLSFTKQGIIKHVSVISRNPVHRVIARLRQSLQSGEKHIKAGILAVGYHTFNLYGLALLKQSHPDCSFWISGNFLQVWNSIVSLEFNRLAKNNPYAYVYNPSGIEIAFALDVFHPEKTELTQTYLKYQFSLCYNSQTNFLELGGAIDPLTLAARLYESTRLPNCEIHLES